MKHALRLLLPGLLLGSCHRYAVVNDELVISYEFWALLIPLIISLVFAGIAAYCLFRKDYRRPSIIAVLLGFFLFIFNFIYLGMKYDRVIVNKEEVVQTTGFWFYPNVKRIVLKDVDHIEFDLVSFQSGTPGIRWVVYYKNSTPVSVDPGDLWNDNSELIINKLKGYGIVFNKPDT